MGKFIKLCDGISDALGKIAGGAMLIGMTLVLTEIVIRALFSKTLYITEEYTAYLMVAITFLGLAHTLKEKGHIRMVFLTKVIKGKGQIVLDIYAFAIGLVVFALITYTTANFFWDSVVTQSRSMQISRTYLAIPQFLMPLGSLIMTIQFVAELFRSLLKLRSGDIVANEPELKELGR